MLPSNEKLTSLIEKYSGQVPRYTSYPTAVEFTEEFLKDSWLSEIDSSTKKVSLYFHIPFCTSLCYFCACNKIITRDYQRVAPYLKALKKEIDLYSKHLRQHSPDYKVVHIHWGGGTPNYLTPEDTKELSDYILSSFNIDHELLEYSVETDPRTTTGQHLEVLKECGFTRISMGVQDFNPHVQEVVNRVQSFELTKELCDQARELGFGGINLDLIYGLPEQTLEGFKDTLEKVYEIRPDRIALYGYAHVTWIVKVQKAMERAHVPTPHERVMLFTEGVSGLIGEGYKYIGLDHFALEEDELWSAYKKGKMNRNFMGHSISSSDILIGLGVSSISSSYGAFVQNEKDIARYQEILESGQFPIWRGLQKTKDDKIREDLIQTLICTGKIDLEALSSCWEIDAKRYFEADLKTLSNFESDGFIEIGKNQVIVTDLGKLFLRNIASSFDAYYKDKMLKQEKRFSQSI